MPKRSERKPYPLIAIVPALKEVYAALDVLSLNLLDFKRGDEDEDDERQRRRRDAQKMLDRRFAEIVGPSEHQATPGDVRILLASVSNIVELLRTLGVR